jgi:hypothetical protein
MKTRIDYERAVDAVRRVIARWDPYSLLAGGAPDDEFDSEVRSIVRQIPRIRAANDAARVISRVFASAFEPSLFQPDNCVEVGHELFRILAEQKLLET